MKRFKAFLLALAMLTCTVLTVGCSNQTQQEQGQQQGDANEAKAVTIAIGGGPNSLDPYTDDTRSIQDIYRCIFEGLVRINENGEIIPLLAEQWEQVNDNTLRFYLRQGVKFHNGEVFNAETVKYNVNRIWDTDLNSIKTVKLAPLKSAEVVDEYTVDLITDEPYPLLLTYLDALYMVPQQYCTENELSFLSQNPVGTGAYKFVSWVPDQNIVMSANEEYWGNAPEVKEVYWQIVPEASTRVSALLAGDVDISYNIPSTSIGQVDAVSGYSTINSPMAMGLVMHLQALDSSAPTADAKVRQALNYAIDREALIEGICQGLATPLDGQMASEGVSGYNPDCNPYTYDPDKAASLLSEAGYANGFKITLNTPQGRYPNDKEIAEVIAGMWRELGIKVEVKVWEWGTFLDGLKQKEASKGAWLIGWYWSPAFDAYTANSYLISDQAYAIWKNDTFDENMRKAAVSVDSDAHEAYLQEALLAMNEDAGLAFICEPRSVFGRADGISWVQKLDDSLDVKTITLGK
ncbi:MAG: ABC transporter substrate-binding protein [Oscillospiraceae bacterium]|nr:ABC transporter substrate-binding protein [Oscillospiraceae bacterium]